MTELQQRLTDLIAAILTDEDADGAAYTITAALGDATLAKQMDSAAAHEFLEAVQGHVSVAVDALAEDLAAEATD